MVVALAETGGQSARPFGTNSKFVSEVPEFQTSTLHVIQLETKKRGKEGRGGKARGVEGMIFCSMLLEG